jgi:CO/xanthine dehydrogenase Mo-binding subunit
MNKVARAVGLSPEEFRARNLLRTGNTTATGQLMTDSVDLQALQCRALTLADYEKKRRESAEKNPSRCRKKGIGFATFFHGAGFTGSGERYLQSVVTLQAEHDGGVTVLSSMTEMGQGTNTILAQIAAETLGIGYAQVNVPRPDTAHVPNSGPTVASRTAMVVGGLVRTAALKLKQTLLDNNLLPEGYSEEQFTAAVRKYIDRCGPLRASAQYQEPPNIFWDDSKYQGDAYGAYSWAVYVAEVSVDIVTGEVQVEDFVALQEVGRVLNPVLAAGQIEGGVAQGIGLALYEDIVWRDGVMANSQMTNYIIPTTCDIPPIRVYFEEQPYPHSGTGAKGIGELPMDGPAPAVLNAVENALGIAFDHAPVLPEHILAALGTREAA